MNDYGKLFCLFLFWIFSSDSQGQNTDSLLQIINDVNQSDSSKIMAFNWLSINNRNSNFKESLSFAEKGLKLSKKANQKNMIGHSQSNIGGAYYAAGKFLKAKEAFIKAKVVFKELGDQEGLSDSYGNIGAVFNDLGETKESIDLINKANHLRDSLGLRKKLAMGLNNLSNIYAKIGDFEKVKSNQIKSISIKKEIGDNNELGRSYSSLVALFGQKGELDSAGFYADKSIGCYKESNNIVGLGKVYFNKGHIANITGNFELAIDYYSKARDCFEKTNNQNALTQTDMSIGRVFYKHGEYEKAISKVRSAIDSLKIHKTPSSLGVAYTTYANILFDWNKSKGRENEISLLDSLLELHEKSYKIYSGIQSKQGMARSLTNIGTVQWKQNNYEQAVTNLEKGISIYNEIGAEKNTGNALMSLGKCFFKLGETSKSIYYLEKAKELNEQNKRFNNELYSDLAGAYAAQNDFKKSYFYLQQKIAVMDSTYSKDKIGAISEVEEKYQTEKKEAENQLLKKEKELQATTIQQQRTTLWGTVGGIGLLGFISFLLYRQNKERKKSNKLLSEKNEKIETLHRELSHRVKNNLAFVSSLMKMQVRRLENEEAKQAVKEGEARINAMSLLHRKLYLKEETKIEVQEYLKEICANLQATNVFNDNSPIINFNADPILMEAETAVRIGLIVNELVTNSFKYAFLEKQLNVPKINIEIKENGMGIYQLKYFDNGKGLPVDLDVVNAKSLGLKLIHTLTKQLNGTLEIKNDNGAFFKFDFQGIKIAA